MKRIWILLVSAILVQGLAAESQCSFQLSANSLNIHEGLGISGEATGSGFGPDTNVEVDCNTQKVQPYLSLAPVKATASAYSSSYYPFRARCNYLAVSQDTAYEISVKLMPQGIVCTPATSGTVTVLATGTSSTQNAPRNAQIEPASNTGINPAAPTNTAIGQITSSDAVIQTAVMPDKAKCGDLGQIPCEKKTNNWMFPVTYVCNAPYVNNGEYPREKARCVACRPGTRHDGGYCVIDNGNKVSPTPTARPTAAATPAPTIAPVITPNPTPPEPSVLAQSQPPINGDEARYVYKFRKGWNTFGLPWAYGDGSYGCSNGFSQIRYYSYNKASQSFEAVTSLNQNNLRSTGLIAYAAVDCDYSIGQPRLTQDQTLTLWRGWNLISVQTNGFGTGTAFGVKNECTITGGPWRYDNDRKQYVRDTQLKPGYGYWIEVKNPFCNLEVMGSENQPPAFP
ncbi:hypothetical protein HY994_03125 [Candidatus Micrarchaeota archaeon]|nr:hypothetical protein [Candidatus Micrarchaeota archaeon]